MRKEVADICNFWLEKGVDGFRCDVITYISKPADLYNASSSEVVVGPHWKEYIKELSAASLNNYDTAIIGEATGIDFKRAAEITREGESLLDMLFHFEHVAEIPVCAYNQKSTNLRRFKKILFKWQKLPVSSWGAVYYENHDQARSIPRFAPSGKYRDKAAKSLALSLLFQKGTPFIYQGQEIGMTNCSFKRNEYRDIQSVNRINDALKLPFGKLIAFFAEKHLQHYARDNSRTPMQWSNEKNGGFTLGKPWMKVNENYKQINVQNQLNDENSVLSFYKKAIALRKEYSKVITNGDFIPINEKDRNVLAFARTTGDKKLLVLCSLSPKAVNFLIPEQFYGKNAKMLLSNTASNIKLERKIKLNPCECAVWEI